MTTIISSSLPFLAKPSTGWDLFSKPPERPISYPPIFPDADETVGPKRIIASRGTEIFVGKGNEVRCADLQDLKARQPTDIQQNEEGYREYKTLDLPDLNFDIHQLEISKDELFLAIVGEKSLAVCMLPAAGLSRMENPKLRVPAFHVVGEKFHHAGSPRIVRVVWHPLGVEGSSLIVLSSDSMVRAYDFTIGQDFTFDNPDQIIDLYALSGLTRINGFHADEFEMEPASCCFGEGPQSWRPFTLYILMRGGDIYALTPLVPCHWKATREYLQNLSLDITADLESLDENTSIQDRLVLRQQTKWINDVLSQEASLANSSGGLPGSPRKRNQTCLTRPVVIGPSPQLQGPFLFQPPPLEFAGDYYACDIFHIEAGAIGVIGVLFSSGKVDICLEFEPLRAKWVDKKKKLQQEKLDLPIIAAYESISLELGAGNVNSTTNWPVFVPDPRSGQVWYVNHSSGVVSFSMKTWLSKLASVIDEDEDEDGFVARLLEKSPQSIVSRVIDHGKRSVSLSKPVTGSVIVYEAYLGHILIASVPDAVESVEFDEVLAQGSRIDDLSAQAQLFREATATPQRTAALHQSGQFGSATTPIQKKTSILSPPYAPSIEFRRPSQLPMLLQQARNRNPRLVGSPIVFSTESSEFLRRARDILKVEYDRIMEAAQEMYDRAALQRIEYRKQLEAIHKASEQLSKLRSKNVGARLEQYLKRQEELQGRADKVLKLLINKGEMGLSDAEKKWVKEVGKIKEKVDGEGRVALAGRKEAVGRMLEELKPLVEGGRGSGLEERGGDVPEGVREGKMKLLRELLEREDVLVKATRRKLENLNIEVDQV